MTFENCEFNILGSCKKILISKDDTVIIDGNGEKSTIKARVESIREEMKETTSEYEKEKLMER